jgi:S1-C subfamily serine protease
VEADGPAAQAGVYVGDILVALAGQPIESTDDVQSHLGSESVGKPIELSIVRGGSAMTLAIVPGERR